jgi:uncharacterized membrane protein
MFGTRSHRGSQDGPQNTVTTPDDQLTVPTPRWLAPTTVSLALIGLGLSAYLTIEHFRGSTHLAGCSVGGIVDCGAVTTSRESTLLGVPVAVLGLLYFVGAIPLLTPIAWRSRKPIVRRGRLLGAILGLGMVLWLVYAELGKIHKICEYCTAVHLVTLALFTFIVYGTITTTPLLAD